MGRGVRISGSAGRLRGSTDLSMVEATDFAKRHDPAGLRPFNGPPVGHVLVEREMRSGRGHSTRSTRSGCDAGGIRSE